MLVKVLMLLLLGRGGVRGPGILLLPTPESTESPESESDAEAVTKTESVLESVMELEPESRSLGILGPTFLPYSCGKRNGNKNKNYESALNITSVVILVTRFLCGQFTECTFFTPFTHTHALYAHARTF